jgi:membrane protein YdbS with pleckstrin-like domain/predicted nucleic acid-binding Zn ribbon protein
MEAAERNSGRYEIVTVEPQAQTPTLKQCIFCAETIQADAIKCRFCNEFLNTEKARALQKGADNSEEGEQEKEDGSVLFVGRPSLFGLIGPAIRAIIVLAAAIFLMRYPAENLLVSFLDRFTDFQISDSQYFALARYRQIAAFGLFLLVVVIFLYKVLKLKMTRYEVTTDRIEHSRGIFDRRVDNLDMFRVVDLKLRRSLLDCALGIGRVTLTTTDKSDPEFSFAKIRGCRRLYDAVKRASLQADQKQGVIHLE